MIESDRQGLDLSALVPPKEMLIDGSSSPEQFVELGENFCRDILIGRAKVAPTAAVLDLGCGNGAVARALACYLSPVGRYVGIDISHPSIAWLQQHYAALPNFQYVHADVYNKMYNPGGRLGPRDYTFPLADSTFDLVLLKSVFTHMVPADVHKYLQEISRVLRPSGRSVISYFLLNDESRRFIDRGLDTLGLKFTYERDPLCRIANPDIPEVTTAHDEQRVRGFYQDTGCSVVEVAYGNWCGRSSLLGLQDVILAIKEPR